MRYARRTRWTRNKGKIISRKIRTGGKRHTIKFIVYADFEQVSDTFGKSVTFITKIPGKCEVGTESCTTISSLQSFLQGKGIPWGKPWTHTVHTYTYYIIHIYNVISVVFQTGLAYAWGVNENYPYKDEKLADKTCVIVVCIVNKFEWDLKFPLA